MRIKIYADESVPVAVVAGLQRRGVEAVSPREAGNLGLTDLEQLAYAIENRFLLFTHDTDFLMLAAEVSRVGQEHWGVVYVHQEKLGIGGCIRRLKEMADVLSAEEMKNHIEFL
jgi:predicted nuclease of predicted toxin-antitoxin system